MPSKGPRVPVRIELIKPEQVVHLRHEVLWPTISRDEQLLPYDFLPSTKHLGAFIVDSKDNPAVGAAKIDKRYLPALGIDSNEQAPVGHLTLTLEDYPHPERLPTEIQGADLTHYQLHKFAVVGSLQGAGIGRRLVEAAFKELSASNDAPGMSNSCHTKGVLLHLDARKDQQKRYESLGFRLLDDEVFIKRGPTGQGTPHEYIRMGITLPSQGATSKAA